MIKVTDLLIPDIEYIKEASPKSQITVHHTVSSKNKGIYVKDTFTLDKGKSKIAVPYVIDADGTIYRVFDPKYYAYHLGIPGVDNIPLCKKSIAIELVNEGPIQVIGGKNKWFDGKYDYTGAVVTTKEWRGYTEFASYTTAQITALAGLIKDLAKTFNIPLDVFPGLDFNIKALEHKGIITHSQVRKDKTDVSPAFPWEDLQAMLA